MQTVLQMAAVALSLLAAAGAVHAADGDALPVVKQAVYSGQTITADMIDLKPRAGLPQGASAFVTDGQSLIGKMARRTLLPGQPIPKAAIREPFIVFQGKTVPVVFQSGTVVITGIAQALESGSEGDLISARNTESGIVIRGVVQSDGTLRAQ
ncbi:MAG: flagellar basal body P-ring formation chaperone FlgA [Rhodomicrobium sp.]|jgi:flagella basal body P-ring formation protein FlgA